MCVYIYIYIYIYICNVNVNLHVDESFDKEVKLDNLAEIH